MQHTSTHTSSQPSTGRCTQSVLIVWASSRGVGRYRALSGASCKRPDTDMAVAATRSAKTFLHRDPRDGDEGGGATSHQPPGSQAGMPVCTPGWPGLFATLSDTNWGCGRSRRGHYRASRKLVAGGSRTLASVSVRERCVRGLNLDQTGNKTRGTVQRGVSEHAANQRGG